MVLDLGKIRLLIVDDSPLSQRMIREALDPEWVEVCGTALTGGEGIELYRSLHPDVVTMDLTLPDIDGLACSREIILQDAGAKIVMLSAIKDEILVARGTSVGVRAFLQKPVKKEPLMMAIMRVCSQTDTVAEWQSQYLQFFLEAFQSNFKEMAHASCTIESGLESGAHYTSQGIAIIVGITGHRHGRVILACDKETATRFMQRVFKSEDISQNEVLNGLAEFANIVAGHGVSQINNEYRGMEFRLTPPSILFGTALSIYNPNLNSVLIRAESELGVIEMSVGFAGGE
ncbi:MAG TPA: response regulator [Patescibacteria group bacterium]|nr:response regulator [Patescibacteria group bacterium]